MAKLRHGLKAKNFKARQRQEVDRMKSRFLFNTPHEFRTPLSLICGPVEHQLLRQRKFCPAAHRGRSIKNPQKILLAFFLAIVL